MKLKAKITLTLLSMVMLFSCDYETQVINTVHKDGSISRKVVMKNSEEKFEPEKYRVPVDSTWQTEIDTETDEEGDTTWILTAEKHFESVDEINEEYINDKGSNRDLERKAHFSKSFRWFTTVYRFSETVEKVMTVDCPASDFLSEEELRFLYLPGNVKTELKNGTDSLKYKALSDIVDIKSETWLWTGFVRQWIEIFYDRFGDHPDLNIKKEEMLSKEPDFVNQIIEFEQTKEEEEEELLQDLEEEGLDEEDIQNLEKEAKKDEVDDIEILVTSVLGSKFYSTFTNEIDSSMSVLEKMTESFFAAENYDMEIRMPGKLVASNGYANTDTVPGNKGGILWSVQGDYFLTQQYEMWAESQTSNYWAWGITALFIFFVITGFVVRSNKQLNS